jgi:5'-nucleotidase
MSGEGRFRKLTILHSNDLHGDFMTEEIDSELLGGVSMLSGYVERARREDENVIYCIAGDMLQGSIIDKEYRGISTIDIMNLIGPDVASLGNHEVDYGLAHLLFLERMARFPIVNANLFIRNSDTRIFTPHVFIMRSGMRIMFIGILTEDVMPVIKSDAFIGTFVDTKAAAAEVGRICNAYRTIDVDFTVLLTHIGFEEDKKLAAMLDPDWGVDLIIGGHSHTILERAGKVNGVLIAQAGVGTKQIGRFDIVVDTDTNSVHDYKWELIPIDASHCPRNRELEEIIENYRRETDAKYNRPLCRFPRALTHPARYAETELGNLFADIFREQFGVDVVILGSGSIRKESAGPILTHGGLMEVFPYDSKVWRLKATGAQLKAMCRYMLRDEAFSEGAHTEFYQFSKGMEVVYSRGRGAFLEFRYEGKPVLDGEIFTIALQAHHRDIFNDAFGFSIDDLRKNGGEKVIATSMHDVLLERFAGNILFDARVEGRLRIVD